MEDMVEDAVGVPAPGPNEDSVDIYFGLDTSPVTVAEGPKAMLSPRVKESMDLYEKIITDEQQSRESSFNELKQRFLAAQCQIEELRRRLQQTEAQNTGLNTENSRLKKNISALLKTARQEVLRKDDEIQKLYQRSERGHPHYRPHPNSLRHPASSTTASTSKLPLPPTDSLPLLSSSSPQPPPPPREDRHRTNLPQVPLKAFSSATHLSRDSRPPSDVHSRCHSGKETRSSRNSSSWSSESNQQKRSKYREDKHESQRPSESRDESHKSGSTTVPRLPPSPPPPQLPAILLPSPPKRDYHERSVPESPGKGISSANHQSHALFVGMRDSRQPFNARSRCPRRVDLETTEKQTHTSETRFSSKSPSGGHDFDQQKQSKQRKDQSHCKMMSKSKDEADKSDSPTNSPPLLSFPPPLPSPLPPCSPAREGCLETGLPGLSEKNIDCVNHESSSLCMDVRNLRHPFNAHSKCATKVDLETLAKQTGPSINSYCCSTLSQGNDFEQQNQSKQSEDKLECRTLSEFKDKTDKSDLPTDPPRPPSSPPPQPPLPPPSSPTYPPPPPSSPPPQRLPPPPSSPTYLPPPPFSPSPQPPPPPPSSPPTESCPQKSLPELSGEKTGKIIYQSDTSCVETRDLRESSNIQSICLSETTAKKTGALVTRLSYSSTGHSDLDQQNQSKRTGSDKSDHRRTSESREKRHKSRSGPNKEGHILERNRSHRAEKDEGKKHEYKSCKRKNYLHTNVTNSSGRAKSPHLDILNGATSAAHGSKRHSEDEKWRSQKFRPEKANYKATDSVYSTASPPHRCKEFSKERFEIQLKGDSHEHRKNKAGRDRSDSKDQRVSCSNLHKHSGKSSRRRVEDSSPRNERKEKRRRKDGIQQGTKRGTAPEQSRDGGKKSSKERDREVIEVSCVDKEKGTNGSPKRPSEEPNVSEKSSVEEDNPNKKLCFMETLNLTLSPVKKVLLPIDGSLQDITPTETGESKSDSEPDIEDFCVIDETEDSLSEMKTNDLADDQVENHSSDIHIPSSVDTADWKRDDRNGKTENGKIPAETTMVTEHPEDNTLQTNVEYSQISEAPVHATTEHGTPKPLTSSFVSPPESLVNLKSVTEKTNCATDTELVKSGELEVTTCLKTESLSKSYPCSSSKEVIPESQTGESNRIAEHDVVNSCTETPITSVRMSSPVEGVGEDPADLCLRENPITEDVTTETKPGSQKTSPCTRPEPCHNYLSPSTSPSFSHNKDFCNLQDGPKDTDTVSSTISLESFPLDFQTFPESLSLPEAIYVLTQTDEDGDSSATEPTSSTGCIGVSKVSSTTEEMVPDNTNPKNHKSVLTFTPKKACSPTVQTLKSEVIIEPSSSMPSLHDEDSMMRTLNNLMSIPDAISPLRSPVRLTRKSNLHGKLPHVKSLQKDFSSTTVDSSSKTLDVNKENKYPGTVLKHEAQNHVDEALALPSSLSDNELEEGEILSESEEGTAASPVLPPKRPKLTGPVRNLPSPKSASRFSKRMTEERGVTSKERSTAVSVSIDSPQSNKKRFKTVRPFTSQTSFSTLEQVMETFKTVRCQIRRKYMKLHKIFPKKSFYGIMENFQESFLEFVDEACFDIICCQVGELKAKLKKMITSVFSKVSYNGIVNRIFEQQAVHLKQKLWDFVEAQLDFLFKGMHSTLTRFCKTATENHQTGTEALDMKSSGVDGEISKQRPVSISSKPHHQNQHKQSVHTILKRIKPHPVSPYRTGLGSRGKDIRITHMESDGNPEPHPPGLPVTQAVVEHCPPSSITSTPEKHHKASLVLCSSLQDRTDFEILTEQQTSSLTFNLARDSQMGEIFKCLLQGSDLLDGSVTAGDSTSWSISTPRRDALPGESLISFTTPTKFGSPAKFVSPSKLSSPSRLITTWSSILPHKITSPQSRVPVPLTPALFDESCLLELPTDSRAMSQPSLVSQRPYSILAEDLAVSLTIPSPLKSDSHLSFLQPQDMELMSTPESVISAHLSEDALLDGDDAIEQDIHLALDTDNSSCASTSSMTLESTAPAPFQFKSHLPMQAVVMERSNDHFIVKICPAATSADSTLIADESFTQTLIEEIQDHAEKDVSALRSPAKAPSSVESPQKIANSSETITSSLKDSLQNLTESTEMTQTSGVLPSPLFDSREEMEMSSLSERSLAIVEDVSSKPAMEGKDSRMSRKRKKRQKKVMVKRAKQEDESSKEKVAKSPKDGSKKKKRKSKSLLLSPNSLSAKNVIRKKGEVVMSWTRDEDRAILLCLKTKGASRETFSALSEKLNKSSAQIADRFAQLMKLFKKQDKMEN